MFVKPADRTSTTDSAIALASARPSDKGFKLAVDARALAPIIAWTSILMGAFSGLVLGLWSFHGPLPTPEWIGGYDALPRRFLRLAHIAFFALGMLHLLVARQIAATPVRPLTDRFALLAMAFGNLAMPLTLIAASVLEPLKYLAAVPALALTFAFSIAAMGAIRHGIGGSQ